MKNSSMRVGLIIAVLLTLILFIGCSQNKVKSNESAEAKTLCEIGKEYEHTAINPVPCNCPSGYQFETVSIGFGPCPREGMRDCPASVLRCVPEK